MITLEISGTRRAFDLINNIQKGVADFSKPLAEVGDVMISEFEQNFDSSGRRLGEPWKKLQASTIKERIRLGYGAGPILVRTGKLMRGFKQEVTKYFVRVSNPVEYFVYHQLGMGYNPQRRMILAPEKLHQQIVEVINKFIKTLL